MTTQVLFQNRQPNSIATLEEYRKSGGYEALTMRLGSTQGPKCSRSLLMLYFLAAGAQVFRLEESG